MAADRRIHAHRAHRVAIVGVVVDALVGERGAVHRLRRDRGERALRARAAQHHVAQIAGSGRAVDHLGGRLPGQADAAVARRGAERARRLRGGQVRDHEALGGPAAPPERVLGGDHVDVAAADRERAPVHPRDRGALHGRGRGAVGPDRRDLVVAHHAARGEHRRLGLAAVGFLPPVELVQGDRAQARAVHAGAGAGPAHHDALLVHRAVQAGWGPRARAARARPAVPSCRRRPARSRPGGAAARPARPPSRARPCPRAAPSPARAAGGPRPARCRRSPRGRAARPRTVSAG